MIKVLWVVARWAWGIRPFWVGQLPIAKVENRTHSPRKTDWPILGRQVAWVLSKFTIVYSLLTVLAWPNLRQASLFPIGLWTLAHPQTLAFKQALRSKTCSFQELPKHREKHFLLNCPNLAVCWPLSTCPISLPNSSHPYLLFLIKEKPFFFWDVCRCWDQCVLSIAIVFWNKSLLYLSLDLSVLWPSQWWVCLIFPCSHYSLVSLAFLS